MWKKNTTNYCHLWTGTSSAAKSHKNRKYISLIRELPRTTQWSVILDTLSVKQCVTPPLVCPGFHSIAASWPPSLNPPRLLLLLLIQLITFTYTVPTVKHTQKNVPSVSTAALVTHLDELSDEPRGIIQDHQLAVWKTRQTGEQLLRGLKITQQCRSTRINLLYLFWIISNFLTYTDKFALS